MSIENFKQVKSGLWRGGQPTEDRDWKPLKDLGISRIVKLNSESEGSDIGATAIGIEVCYYPIPLADQIIFRPNKLEVMHAIQAIDLNIGTFVHCTHGVDRTGLAIACFRRWCDGWSKDAAWKEMIDCGFHPELLGLTLFFEWIL